MHAFEEVVLAMHAFLSGPFAPRPFGVPGRSPPRASVLYLPLYR